MIPVAGRCRSGIPALRDQVLWQQLWRRQIHRSLVTAPRLSRIDARGSRLTPKLDELSRLLSLSHPPLLFSEKSRPKHASPNIGLTYFQEKSPFGPRFAMRFPSL